MKQRKYTQGITIFTTPEMYQSIRAVSDNRGEGLSELLREIIACYLACQPIKQEDQIHQNAK